MGVRSTGSGNDLLPRRLRFAVGDVFGDGAEKQEGLLKHEADVLPVVGYRQRADIDPIQQDRAFGHVIETGRSD